MRLAVLLGERPQEVIDERRQILAPLAQRRQLDRDHVDAVVEVLAEPPLPHEGLQIPVGRREEPHVHLDRAGSRRRARTPAPGGPGAASPEGAGGRSPISSRKRVPPSASSKRPLRARDRAGEGALLVAEELGLQQALGQGRAVDLHERARRRGGSRSGAPSRSAPCRCRSRPGSARWHRSGRPGGRPRQHLLHRAALADDPLDAVALGEGRAELAVLGEEALALPDLVDRCRSSSRLSGLVR